MNRTKPIPHLTQVRSRRTFQQLIALFVASLMTFAVIGNVPAQATEPQSSSNEGDGVISITPITEILTFGQKVRAVAIEYSEPVDASQLTVDTYTVSDRDYVFRFDDIEQMDEMADRTITAVYTNSSASLLPDTEGVAGNFVIIELDQNDRGGNTVVRSTCQGNLCFEAIEKNLPTSVTHNKPVYAAGTNAVLAQEDLAPRAMTNAAINLVADSFVYDTFTTETGMAVPYAYHLPENYNPDVSYPMVVMLHGWGSGSNGINDGVQVAVDSAVTSWLDPELTGTQEDVIVLAPQTPRGDSADEAEATVELVNSFTSEYSVDSDRMAVTTFSWGSTLAWHALSEYPGLFDAALFISGFPVSEDQASKIASSRLPIWLANATSDPVLPVTFSQSSLATLQSAYAAEGMSEDQIADTLRYTEFSDDAFAIPDYHAATGPVFSSPEIPTWIMSRIAAKQEASIVSVQPVTEVSSYGQRVMKVIVEFASEVNAEELGAQDFTVQDSEYNFRFQGIEDLPNLIDRPISDVYTTDDPARVLSESRPAAPGKYVVLTLDPEAEGGWTVIVSLCPTFLCSVRINPDQLTQVSVNSDIFGADGTLLAPADAERSYRLTKPAIDRDTDQFENAVFAGDEGEVRYSYRLPAGYDSAKKYPLVVALPGHGMGYDGQNVGVQLASDTLATTWLHPERTGTNDEVIVLAPQNERVGKEVEGAQAVELIEDFMARFSVDSDRVYAASVSYGSQLMWEMFSTRPDLFTAGLLTGGFPGDDDEFAPIAKAKIPMWITHGTSDHLLPVENARASYEKLVAAYEEAGTSEEEIAKLALWTEYGDEAFTLPDYHLAAAPTLEDKEPARWLLSQVKGTDQKPVIPGGEEPTETLPTDGDKDSGSAPSKILASTGAIGGFAIVAALLALAGVGLVAWRRRQI